MSCDIFECYNYRCLFRVNDLPVDFHCECIACPNRCKNNLPTITSNRMMTNEELESYVEFVRYAKLKKAAKLRKGN